MKRREFLVASASLPGVLVPAALRAESRPCPPTTLGVRSGTSVTSNCGADAHSDWLARSTGSGVIWAHEFSSDAEIEKFLAPSVDRSRVVRAAAGGPGDFGYLRCLNPAGVPAGGNIWERPLSALPGEPGYEVGPDFDRTAHYVYGRWQRGYYGHPDYWNEFPGQFAGHEFFMQMRIRVSRGRWTTAHEGGKVIWFADTGYTPAQEFNGQALYDGRFAAYINFGASNANVAYSPQVTPPSGQKQSWQAGGEYDGRCVWTVGQTYPSDCWKWPGYLSALRAGEWVTFLVRLKLGHECGSFTNPIAGANDSEVEVWVAEEKDLPSNGGQGYRKLIDRKDALWVYTSNRVKGLNSLRCGAYFNGFVFKEGWEQNFAQLILSKSYIPCPYV